MRFSTKAHPGFTLIELLVSIAIIGILSAVIIGGLTQQKNYSLARRTAEQLQNDIQAAQNSALSGQTTGGSRPAGYGLFASSTGGSNTSYTTFADTGDNTYQVGEKVQTVTLGAGMSINKITVTNGANTITPSQLNLVYSVPAAKVALVTAGPTLSFTAQTVTLLLKNSSLNVCYAVNVAVSTGTVSNRSYNPLCT